MENEDTWAFLAPNLHLLNESYKGNLAISLNLPKWE